VRAEALISETLKLEETRFRKTLERGLSILDEESKALGQGATFSGDTAFTLYDTFGFPLDLTQDALRPRGIDVDTQAFNDAMLRQKEKARAAWAGSGEAATDAVWFAVKEKTGATEFLGYDTEMAEGQVLVILKDGGEVAELAAGESGHVIVNQTPFYGESGGQQGDRGTLSGGGVRAAVTDTQKKLGDLFIHAVTVGEGVLKVGQAVELEVDHGRRAAIRANHSATHLLHEALRQVLGDHVAQKGSLVAPDRLRFDFSHPKPITDEELARAEDIANRVLLTNQPVVTRLMAVDDAMASGARALFGEKYGEEVRVVSMGPAPAGSNAAGWSVELCGGTHVARTGDIGLVTIVGEGAVAAGVRRVEAMTGDGARHHLAGQARKLEAVAGLVKTSVADVETRVEALVEERRKLERELSEAKKKLAMGGGAGAADPVKTIGSVRLLAKSVTGIEMRDLKGLADAGKVQVGSGVVAIVGVSEDGKAGIVVGVTPDLTSRLNAVDLVRLGSEALGGKGGGGRPDMAQAGGPDGSKADEALAAIEAALAAAA
jgi:alanyl-tRNA synthetase